MSYLIRKARVTDAQALLELLSIAFNRTPSNSFDSSYFDNKDSYTLVIEKDTLIIATASLYMLKKLDRVLGQVEDVVVAADYQGQGHGKNLVLQLIEKSIQNGSYKTILNTAKKNIPFYQSLGFSINETQMLIKH